MKGVVSIETSSKAYLEKIQKHHLDKIIIDYDEKIFHALKYKQFSQCEQHLSDLCFELIDLSNEEQVIILRMFFISMINDIIKMNIRKKRLHPQVLAYAYGMISTIEKWENISEFLLSIPSFVNHLKIDIIRTGILFEVNSYVEKAIDLIHDNLEDKRLTVNWLADQLNISTTHLSNLFKIQLDDKVSNYIMSRKMDEIVYELTYTNNSIKVISERYGFSNQSHFIKQFKKYQGVTPLQFVKQLQESYQSNK